MAETLGKLFYVVIMINTVLRKDLIAKALAPGTASEDMVPETEAEAAFEATHVTVSTTHTHRLDLNSETYAHDGTMNIHVSVHLQETCHV